MTEPQVTVVDEWIKTSDGTDIFTKTWKPTTTPVAQLLLIHGFGEHVNRYDDMCKVLASHGIQCYGYDQRGWGETGKRAKVYGDNQGYDTALKDVNEAVHKLRQKEGPVFILGHSMGGGILLNYLSRKDQYDGVQYVKGAIASAPLVTLTHPLPAIKYYPLLFISNFLPNFVISAGLDPKGISHDEQQVEAFKNDPLVHDYATLATIRGFLNAGQDLFDRAKSITTPVLFSHGDADPINKYESTKQVYQTCASQDKILKTWPGLYHEPHKEKLPERDQVIRYYQDWILSHL
ncbi:Alpha/Beta hydrolase protein [Radiomyces spectabilis]|uniref:Alpha/Beta hydrolase protein n=1 Tax=Radiomyces spectabilis TaxID=64574 RepID=UPI00221F54C6|nr:Alpha/Beta hydrolase protein [Radiomyces spectabilis]KAI8387967.1 Alpha/Beta hydrolase protein [Radiomyces spectabilis]